MERRPKHVLVTGGAGYIGSMLTREVLKGGNEVTIIDSLRNIRGESLLGILGEKNLTFIKEDTRNLLNIEHLLKDTDAVVHLAAIVGQPACNKYPEEAYETNLVATKKLFNKALEYKVPRFIFASTCSNYGMTKGGIVTEDDPVEPTSLYANTKIEAEKHLLGSKNPYTHATILRFSTAFGLSPRMRMDLLIHEFLRDAMYKKKIVVFGPNYWRPFVHVRDIVRAITTVLNAPIEKVSYQIYNVGNSQNNIMKGDLAKLVARHVPDTMVKVIETEKDFRNYRVSFDKISSLGYSTTKTIEDGIIEVKEAIEKKIIDPYDIKWYYNPPEE